MAPSADLEAIKALLSAFESVWALGRQQVGGCEWSTCNVWMGVHGYVCCVGEWVSVSAHVCVCVCV